MSGRSLRFWLSKASVDGLFAALISAVVTAFFFLTFETHRDRVQRTHDYVLLFHSDAHSAYRDVLTRASMLPDVFEKRMSTEEEYAAAVFSAATVDATIVVAVFGMTDLLINVRSCIRAQSCIDGPQTEALRTFAHGFYDNFYPFLRWHDCANEDQNIEALILSFVANEPGAVVDCEFYLSVANPLVR